MITFRRRFVPAAIIAIAIAVPAGVALAQTTAPVAPTVTPTPNCEKPGDAPSMVTSELGKAMAEQKRNTWTKNAKAYIECLKHFIDEEQAIASPHVRAANAAIEEYNKSIKVFNEQLENKQ